ncbi:hypothetical protein KUTeg_024398 [Tegillarca granosa]|uniref:Uncharacterized protein n=1 Tax=Tegillarca granosa TaxID=220873 RepID=A0ABQ9E2R2_TEGGR|nr:hypothetical protein KUTeg_024398 [Tegillarca granosa]
MAASMRTCVLFKDIRIATTFSRRWTQFNNLGCDRKCHLRCFVTTTSPTKTVPIYQARHHQNLTLQRTFTTSSYLCTKEAKEDPIVVEPIIEDVKDESSTATDGVAEEEDYHSIIKDTERSKGPADSHEFKAETKKLLDIVAKSLYSEKEVFIRELISNSSDALEKLRYLQTTHSDIVDSGAPLEIHLATDDSKKTFTIQDTGIGMTSDEMVENLGTIAKSGSKAFLESLGEASNADVKSQMIGQFGVGFYSSFMLMFTLSLINPILNLINGHQTEAEGVQRGTKIVIHLKGDCYDFAKEDIIKDVVKKYSNFVGVPIYLNGKKINIVQALWMMDPKDITDDMHEEFYRFIGNVYDKPRYHFMYKTDAPLNIRALFYVPEYKPTMFDLSRETDVSVNLYSRKVMILSKADHILPKWLRFLKGVVDSEDIPLNLSRELLQDSALIRKLRQVLTNRILKFFLDQSKKDEEKYMKFYQDYGLFFREGIVTQPEQEQREDIAKLLRFESSKCPRGQKVSLEEYASRMKAGARDIYYLSAPSRELAETSPYLESLVKKDIEVLFCFEPYDELVLMNLGQFNKKFLKSIENEIASEGKESEKVDDNDPDSLKQDDVDNLITWIKGILGNKAHKVKITKRLASHPCIVTVEEMGSARHFLRTTFAERSQEERFSMLKEQNPELGTLIVEQLYDNAMIHAGLMDDPRTIVGRINSILEKALEKY